MENQTTCLSCYKDNASVACLSCKVSAYCSSACLDKDAGPHSIICRSGADFIAKSPQPIFHLCLYLAEDKQAAEFVWVPFSGTEANIGIYIPETKRMAKDNSKKLIIQSDERTIEMISAPNKLSDGSKENQCLTHLMKGKEQYAWRGPILIVAYNKDRSKSMNTIANDLQEVKKCFENRASLKRKRRRSLDLQCNFASPNLKVSQGTQAVMISCQGDMDHFSQNSLSQVSINPSSWIGATNSSFMLLHSHLDLGLEFYKYDSGVKVDDPHKSYFTNEPLKNLCKITKGQSKTKWGRTGYKMEGSYLVTRLDGGDLHVYHMLAMIRFCEQVLIPDMEKRNVKKLSVESLPSAIRDGFVAENANHNRFVEYFNELKKEQIWQEDEAWAAVNPPALSFAMLRRPRRRLLQPST